VAAVTPEQTQKLESWVNSTLADRSIHVCLHADRTTTVLPGYPQALRLECDYCPAEVVCPAGLSAPQLPAYYFSDPAPTGFEPILV
jgi:hypothetical protein